MRSEHSPLGTRLFRLSEAATYLGVSISTVYHLVERGHLEALTLPGLRGSRFAREDLDALIEQAKRPRKS